MPHFHFEPAPLPPDAESFREEVRAFIAEAMPDRSERDRAESWSGFDPEFSRKLGQQGWIGMTWPKQYGGAERSFLERYVMMEEMLAAGAPVANHWIADRQSGQLILRFGTEEQRQELLPPITRGESFYCIGMSEPDSGSDLASVRSRADKVDGGYKINGRKVWTTGAHLAHNMIALLRTGDAGANRHEGLTQFVIDMTSPGLTVRPIIDLAVQNDFNEVTFDDVFVPDNRRVGDEGDGWKQVTAELAFERSGPERYLSSYRLLVTLIDRLAEAPDSRATVTVGRLVARLANLREMSLSVAAKLEAGGDPALDAAVVKDLGALFEQAMPGIAQELVDDEPTNMDGDDFQETLAYLMQIAPSFSLRGGTREILRGIIARGLGLR